MKSEKIRDKSEERRKKVKSEEWRVEEESEKIRVRNEEWEKGIKFLNFVRIKIQKPRVIVAFIFTFAAWTVPNL